MAISLLLNEIRVDGDSQSRLDVDPATVDRYAENLKEGTVFPPLKAIFDGTNYWLWDGFHTWFAGHKAGRESMEVEVTQGTLDDARWLAASANKEHDKSGRGRSNADKHRAVEMALQSELGKQKSDRFIAEHIGVSHEFVRQQRDRLSTVDSPAERTGRDGRTINTTNIGKKKEEPLPAVVTFPESEPLLPLEPDLFSGNADEQPDADTVALLPPAAEESIATQNPANQSQAIAPGSSETIQNGNLVSDAEETLGEVILTLRVLPGPMPLDDLINKAASTLLENYRLEKIGIRQRGRPRPKGKRSPA